MYVVSATDVFLSHGLQTETEKVSTDVSQMASRLVLKNHTESQAQTIHHWYPL